MIDTIDMLDELRQDFIDSSYDVNCNRAFPDARDGLKPGQRAILWEMHKKGFTHDKPHVKSAKVSGSVIAELWPHGSAAIYETFVHMSQPFSNSFPELEFHGANGNIIAGGDAFAAERYTETRLSEMAEKFILSGVEMDAVDMIPNFSEDEMWPKVLPSVFPRLLVNGSQGIGVSISGFWCTHNLGETCDMIQNYLSTGEVDTDNYYPDFPTGGTIINKSEVPSINKTGKGKVVVEGRYTIKGQEITFTEFPYQVYVEPVIEELKTAVEQGKITGIKRVTNKSDKTRTALVIDCKAGFDPQGVVTQVLSVTSLRTQYNVIQRAIISKTPELLTLSQEVEIYVAHNKECIKRMSEYIKNRAQSRLEILDGLLSAIADIDNVINIIRSSRDGKEAKTNLQERYGFSDAQVGAILEMKLSRLANLEGVALEKEKAAKEREVKKYAKIVESEKEQASVLSKRLADLKEKYSSPRKTALEDRAVETISELATSDGSKYDISFSGDKIHKSKTQDGKYLSSSSVLLLSETAKVYRLKVEDLSDGMNPGAVLPERIVAVNPWLVYIATEMGKVKAIDIHDAFDGNTRNKTGMDAIKLQVGDKVVSVMVPTDDGATVVQMQATNSCIKFRVNEVPVQGKAGSGVKGISLKDGEKVLSAVLTTDVSNVQKRGGKGF